MPPPRGSWGPLGGPWAPRLVFDRFWDPFGTLFWAPKSSKIALILKLNLSTAVERHVCRSGGRRGSFWVPIRAPCWIIWGSIWGSFWISRRLIFEQPQRQRRQRQSQPLPPPPPPPLAPQGLQLWSLWFYHGGLGRQPHWNRSRNRLLVFRFRAF